MSVLSGKQKHLDVFFLFTGCGHMLVHTACDVCNVCDMFRVVSVLDESNVSACFDIQNKKHREITGKKDVTVLVCMLGYIEGKERDVVVICFYLGFVKHCLALSMSVLYQLLL